jgi:hypothetical protein
MCAPRANALALQCAALSRHATAALPLAACARPAVTRTPMRAHAHLPKAAVVKVVCPKAGRHVLRPAEQLEGPCPPAQQLLPAAGRRMLLLQGV